MESFLIDNLPLANGKWELLEIIGEGTYGEVYRGRDTKKNQAAIKVIENSHNKHEEIGTEMSIFQRYSSHPNLVDYFGTFLFKNDKEEPTQIWMVMEYCEGRSVAELAKSVTQNGQRLSENVIRYIMHQTLEGINFLHKNHVIHRDIKGPNILMSIQGNVKLIDYGVSAHVPTTMARRHSSVGSPFWMAPEVVACEQQLDYNYDNRCDIWSLGITAIELADGDPPLAEEHPMRALFKIPRNPPPTVRFPKKWSSEFLEFVSRAVTKDFEVRPVAEELLRDPFLEKCTSEEHSLRKELMSLIHVVVKQYADTSSGGGAMTLMRKQENAKKNVAMLEAADLAKLPRLSEEIILKYVMERYAAEQIYTYIGEILLAVNPFKELKIYGDGAALLYQDAQKEFLPPHIFMIACTTYQAMVQKQHDQCCVISGESGSGKTMSANFLVRQFASIGKSHDGVSKGLVKKILQVNPLIEAFGNAQTIINPNSSRFGKFLELHFTYSGALVGAQLTEYLLEKSRVVSQPRGERNFHILYYMIAGLDFHHKLAEFELSTSGKHRYLNTDDLSLAECACTSEMQMKFTNVQECFENLGFTSQEIQSLYCVLAAVIHLGDIDFTIDDDNTFHGEKAKIMNEDTLEIVCSLLGVESDNFNEATVTYSNVLRGETITRNNNIEQAMDCRDATAKALYGRLFSWIVKKINTLLRAEDRTQYVSYAAFHRKRVLSKDVDVKIQLCINIANEQLQFFFNEHVFVWEYEEYQHEGIKGASVEFKNNKDILDLFLQKPVGILALLDEESRFPKASDLSLVEKFQDNIHSEYMKTAKDTSTFFTVTHYAGKVTYDATGFLEKNRDTLSADVIAVLQESTDETVSTLFHSIPSGSANEKNPLARVKGGPNGSASSTFATNRFQQTTSTHFRQSLRSLLSKVIRSDPHFVRCIRPNLQNVENMFDQDKVRAQLKYTGVLETIKIRQQGYSERIPFKDFVQRYKYLLYENVESVPVTPETCVRLLREAKIDEDETWQIGHSKLFLKYWHAERLSRCYENYLNIIMRIQHAIRLFLMRRSMKKHSYIRSDAATKIRAAWVGYCHRKRYKELLEEQRRNKSVDAEDATYHGSVTYRQCYALAMYIRLCDLICDDPPDSKTLTSNSVEELSKEEVVSDSETVVTTRSLRPFYRNMKRERVGWQDYAEFYDSDDDNASTSMKRKQGSEKGHDKIEKLKDLEGQAALEETRAIILLSQIDLASKEAFEMLNRTSYPVIHSNRAQMAKSGGKTKNQKLNHRERVIAVVDGYGDPLQPKYRSAKMHLATGSEDKKAEPQTVAFQNSPMLGLQERPVRQSNTALSDEEEEHSPIRRAAPRKQNARKQAPTKKSTSKPAPKKSTTPSKRNTPTKKGNVSKPVAVDQEQYYPSRMSGKSTPRNNNEWFYPSNAGYKVLQEKTMIENRMRNIERDQKRNQQQQQPPRRPSTDTANHYRNHYRPNPNDYKPYNYLLNARTDQSKLIGHDINSSPVHKQRRVVQAAPYNPPTNYQQPIKYNPTSQYNIDRFDPSSQYNPPSQLKQHTPTPYNSNVNWYDHGPPAVPVKSQKQPPLTQPKPVNENRAPRMKSSINADPVAVDNYTPPEYDESNDFDYEGNPKRRRYQGFNYGLNQRNVLNLKLKKTGRLQELLVK